MQTEEKTGAGEDLARIDPEVSAPSQNILCFCQLPRDDIKQSEKSCTKYLPNVSL